MCSCSVKIFLFVTILASGRAQRRSQSRLAFHDIKDVFFQHPERYDIIDNHPRTLQRKSNSVHKSGDTRETHKSSGWITKCRGLECISMASDTNPFLDKALNVLDNTASENDYKNTDRPESSLAKLLATTSGVENSNLETNDKRTNNTHNKLTKKSHGKTKTGSKRQNWFNFPRGHNDFGPHLPNHPAPPPIHVMDPFYSHGNGGAHTIHPMHPFHPLMHPGEFHTHLVHHVAPPLVIHHHHRMTDFKTHGGLFGSVPPYPLVPGSFPGPNLPGPPIDPLAGPPPVSFGEPFPGQFIHNAGPPIEGHHVEEPPVILPGIVHSEANGMSFPRPPPRLQPPPVEFGKPPYTFPYQMQSAPRIKQVPVPFRVPVRGPSIIQKYYYPVRVPAPSQIHHVPYPVYIHQPPAIKPYFVRVPSPPQRIPVPVPSPPKVYVQRVPYPVMIPRPVQIIHNNQIYSGKYYLFLMS